jgi:hypothetical protein
MKFYFYFPQRGLIIALLALLLGCENAQTRKIDSTTSDSTKYAIKDSNNVPIKDNTPLEVFTEQCADSINQIKGSRLPFFLSDPEFDYNYSIISGRFHSYWPLRKKIIDKVNNCTSLKLIVGNTTKIYRKKPVTLYQKKIEFSEFSWHELAVKRLIELNCAGEKASAK